MNDRNTDLFEDMNSNSEPEKNTEKEDVFANEDTAKVQLPDMTENVQPEKTEKKINSKMLRNILIALICLVVIGASVGLGYYIAKHPADNKPSQDSSSTSQPNEQTDNDIENSEDNSSSNNSETSNTSQNKGDIANAILGKWNDNANLSGYEFLEGGVVKVTYFNMSSINLEDIIDGTYTGTYVIDGNKITVSYTIYSKAVVKEYTADISENLLTLTATDGNKSVYVREGTEEKMENTDNELLGSWSSNLSGYEFKDTGVVSITYIDLSSMGINIPISGKVDGVYTVDGDTLNIKFSIYSAVIEKKYTYSIDGKILTLTDKESGEKGTYIKQETVSDNG